MEDNELIHETPSHTPNFRTELAQQLAELMPEVVADGKIDTVKLKELLAEDVADETERFGLFWPGKRRAMRAAQEPTTATLRPDKANSKDWDTTQNVFIEGDNLEVLKILQKHYHNKIKLIYIDPPYNTGKDFVYPDNYREGLQTYLEWTRQVTATGNAVSTNAETEGRYHSNWLNMMYPRLKLARNLLSPDGLLFVSIDDNELDNIRKLLNEVFGESNFQSYIIPVVNPGGRDYRQIAVTNEYLLVFSRSASATIGELPKDVEFSRFDSRGGFEFRELRNRNPKFDSGNRPSLFYPFFVDVDNVDEDGFCTVSLERVSVSQIEVRPYNSQGKDSVWRWGKTKVMENIVQRDHDRSQVLARRKADGGWNVYEKSRKATTKAKSVWAETEMRTESGTREIRSLFGKSVFDHPKPLALLLRCLQIGSDRDSLVLDLFAGSATTAHAVMAANAHDGGTRAFIAVQLPEPTPEGSEACKAGYTTVADIARKRIELAGKQLRDETGLIGQQLDFGFRAFKLADTNFAKWNVSSNVDRTALEEHLFSLRDGAKDDATSDDLLFELLLKQGYSLIERFTTATIDGLDVRVVGDNLILAYLNEEVKPTLDQLRALAAERPAKIIVLEDAFHGDDELKTNLAQLCRSKGIELWTA